MTNQTLSCIIVEDQVPAQRVLQRYISDTPQLKLISVCDSALEASIKLAKENVEVIFLDLHLPKLGGFDFIKGLQDPPLIVVTTADADGAIEGFSLNVVDYLLKPFSFERFVQSVSKLQREKKAGLGTDNNEVSNSSKYLFLKSGGEIHRVDIDKINFVKSVSDYVEVFTRDQKFFTARTLKGLLASLPDDEFLQVHKSYIVRVGAITRIAGDEIFIAGAVIPVGRSFKERLMEKIGHAR